MVHCVVCARTIPRRWWQVLVLRPLPICLPPDTDACRAAAGLPAVAAS